MGGRKTSSEDLVSQSELRLDLDGLLGFRQVFAAGDDAALQAELIDANCNKMGVEGCCCS